MGKCSTSSIPRPGPGSSRPSPLPTRAQTGAWQAIAERRHALVVAPTGSGKTLAAFLWSLDRLLARGGGGAGRGVRVLYVSPLKALAVDVERNLRAPLAGIRAAAQRLELTLPAVSAALRTGDTPAAERRRFPRDPADILITTPESLYLLLGSGAREVLRTVDTVIVDEIHALAGSKRGSHLAVSLERLDVLLPQPAQRIGLSATVRPIDEVARFPRAAPAGDRSSTRASRSRWRFGSRCRSTTSPAIPAPRRFRAAVAARAACPASIWPHVEERRPGADPRPRSTIISPTRRRSPSASATASTSSPARS
jgi:ATP-dependent Lhr-like helicase